jgi:crotonobetaine/carnitine-CoA ligase
MSDPRMPPPEAVVTRHLIDGSAEKFPDKTFVLFDDGSAWTYRELRQHVIRAAQGLQTLGVQQGDYVLSWLGNGPRALTTWFGLNYLGAVYVPLNTAYRGSLLQHVVLDTNARLMIGDHRLIPRLNEIKTGQLEKVVSVGGGSTQIAGVQVLPDDSLNNASGELAPLSRPIQPWDTHAIIYTSGTTGPSKGVLSSYLHIYSTGRAYPIDGNDRTMVNIPLFHQSGIGAVYRMLMHGGSIALVESFNTYSFWDKVRQTGTTTLTLLGAMAPFLMKQPPGDKDRDHPLRMVTMVPLGEDAAAFSERFGVQIYTAFNMTETSCPIFSGPNPKLPGTCGRARDGVELRIVDENDCEVPVGQVGELVIRTDMPWAMNHGYHNNPEATARAWRNGWFHTGDAFRKDEEGNYYFVDRMKDAIRRRGENISSFEVENEVCAHPDVREAAVIPAKSEFSEDEVMVVVAPVPGRAINARDLISFLAGRLPHFMIPRYVRVVSELPKTPTHKVQKYLLRADGVTEDTWDREKEGIVFKRQALT